MVVDSNEIVLAPYAWILASMWREWMKRIYNTSRLNQYNDIDHHYRKEPPKHDTTPSLNDKDKEIYMSLVGSTQWSISIGRFDI